MTPSESREAQADCESAASQLRTLPQVAELPEFQSGWRRADGSWAPFLSFVDDDHSVNWSDELEELHEESSRDHFIDVWTRRSMLERIGPLPRRSLIVDLGCSTGYLLEDLQRAHPDALLAGVDLVAAGLRKAHVNAPQARLLQADVCDLPLEQASVDAALSANLLEHVPDDRGALRELRRVLKPGARGVLVVPAAPSTYDYYDRFLGHERRYARGELAGKARDAGLEVLEDIHLGSVLFPAFWLVKQRNRRRYASLVGAELERRVAANIAGTRDSPFGRAACGLERALLNRGVRLPFGIRGLTVVRRPEERL
ncbi:MAG TPA: class I SAM-dependent methyltransferase [Solirubrobacteraceae bacterium]|nr:class I SAM-dependent methyltransferase [Solirubrobacteraceae bacterium]